MRSIASHPHLFFVIYTTLRRPRELFLYPSTVETRVVSCRSLTGCSLVSTKPVRSGNPLYSTFFSTKTVNFTNHVQSVETLYCMYSRTLCKSFTFNYTVDFEGFTSLTTRSYQRTSLATRGHWNLKHETYNISRNDGFGKEHSLIPRHRNNHPVHGRGVSIQVTPKEFLFRFVWN